MAKDSTLSNAKKKEWSQELYTRGELTQKEIALKVGTSENTIVQWIKKGLWDNQRKTLLTTKREQIKIMYDQLVALNKSNYIAMTDDDPDTNPNLDGVVKLAKSIQLIENKTGVGEMIDTGMDFIKFVFVEDPALAKQITHWFDLFIESRLKEL